MPEGHTIHRLALDLQELVGHQVLASSPQGRFEAQAEAIDNQKVESVEGFGKNLLVNFSTGDTVHVHLGLKGKFLRFPDPTGQPMAQVRLRLQTEDVAWDLIAPSSCNLLQADERTALISKLGPDPLRDDADRATAIEHLRSFRGAIGVGLMDQSVVAGVGNVFRAEALHACRIAPQRPASKLSNDEANALWDTLQAMMHRAVLDRRIITVDADEDERSMLPEELTRRVYKQEHCYDCGADVKTAELHGRTAYWCPKEQAS